MDREEATQALELLRRVVSQARDDTTLQNWGVIWMFHGVTNAVGFIATNLLMWRGHVEPWPYVVMWGGILTVNIVSIFLLKSNSAGARTFIENQIWLIWLSFIVAVVLTALVNHLSGFKVFTLGPIVGVLSAFGFAMMGGVMGKRWFWGTVIFGVAAIAMALAPGWQFIILGATWGVLQVGAGVFLHRAKLHRLAAGAAPAPRLV